MYPRTEFFVTATMFVKIGVFSWFMLLTTADRDGGRIIGAIVAAPHEFPHMVTLDNSDHVCGGSILNEYWVVTAAHCLSYEYEDLPFQIKAGKHSLKTVESTEQVINVAERFPHEGYPGGRKVASHDIALLKLEEPLVFNEFVRPIALPKQNTEVTGTVILSGWGKMEEGVLPDKLRRAKFDIVDFEACRKADEAAWGPPSAVTKTMLCAGPSNNNAYACNLDSGSPLIKQENNKSYLVGVFSWLSPPCGVKQVPSVFTKVSYYVDWINNIMSNN